MDQINSNEFDPNQIPTDQDESTDSKFYDHAYPQEYPPNHPNEGARVRTRNILAVQVLISLFEMGYITSSVGDFGSIMTSVFAIVVFVAVAISFMKFIEAAIGLHYLANNTERTLSAMESHVNLSLATSLFVTLFTSGLLLTSNYFKSQVTDDLINGLSAGHHVTAGQSLLDTLSRLDMYLFLQLLYFFACVCSFKQFQSMEQSKVKRVIDNQALD